jgi:hypothetical protein
MVTDDLMKQIAFIKEIDKLKYIQRKTKLLTVTGQKMTLNIAGIWR